MREDELRDRFRDALGEPPPLRMPQLGPAAATSPRNYTSLMAVLAALLALVLIVVLVGTRVMLRPQGVLVPATTPSASAPPTAIGADSFPCALPAMVTTEVGAGSPTYVVGFVNLPAGGFLVDPAATVADLPRADGFGPTYYSTAARRWLPAVPPQIAPDGLHYAFAAPSGAGSTSLHVVDVSSKKDRVVWTYAATMNIEAWDGRGIVVMTTPFAGGESPLWRVDPATGKAVHAPYADDPSQLPVADYPGNGIAVSPIGSDGHGATVFRFGSRDPGAKYSVVVVAGGKVTTTLYSGVVNDAKDFDPGTVAFDGHGMWLGNVDGSRVWLWRADSGLRSFAVTGLPVADAPAYRSLGVVGGCVAGTFGGVAASPIAAPTPSPSPSIPAVDWTPLLARPLQLPAVAAGSACPASSMENLNTQISTPKKGNGPNYGYGQWPTYISGQTDWYSDGSQGVIILTSPEYTGPVLMRVKRLDGAGSATFAGLGPDLGGGATGIPVGGSPPYWGSAFGSVTFSAPGCYGVQFDGNSWTSVAVIEVKKGPPPPG